MRAHDDPRPGGIGAGERRHHVVMLLAAPVEGLALDGQAARLQLLGHEPLRFLERARRRDRVARHGQPAHRRLEAGAVWLERCVRGHLVG